MGRPLLFLDVDGPLLPFGDGPQRQPSGSGQITHLARLDPQVGLRLAALPCDLVWATTWVSARHPGRALLHHVPSSRGLTDDDLIALDHWLRAV
jgi:hypothetical protein